MRRKPAHCSKVLSPRRGTFSSSLRRLNGPFSSRCRTMFSATVADNPETRASRAAEAVFTCTPTAFTQSSTRASSARARRYWSTSCWYWPTPIAFGSIFTSSASGSCRRRAIDTAPRSADVEFREFPRRQFRSRIHRRAGFADHDLLQLQLRMQLADHFASQLVGLARGGAVADRDQFHAVLRAQLAPAHAATGPIACAARADRSCRWPPACRCGRPRRLSRRCGCPDPGPSPCVRRQARPAAGP